MILSNVELHWVKLDPDNCDMGFDKNSPQWVVDVRTRDKTVSEDWKKQGLNVNVKDDDDGIFYNVKLKKSAVKKNGDANKPVPVVGRDVMPLDPNTIGNGTIANVKVHTFDYNYNGRAGVGFRLEAVQVVELVAYSGKAGGIGFAVLDDAGAASDTSSDSADIF